MVLDLFTRGFFIGAFIFNHTQREISEKFQVPKSTHYQQTKSGEPLKSSGRPAALDDKTKQQISLMVEENPLLTAADLAKDDDINQQQLSEQTYRNTLNELGLFARNKNQQQN